MIEEIVPPALAGERVDRAVAMLTGCTRSEATRLVAEGGVRLNRRLVRKGADRLDDGDVLLIDDGRLDRDRRPAPQPDISLEIVYEDEHVVVLDKPPGLVVHPGSGTPDGTLVNALVARYPDVVSVGDPQRPGIVHRLDKGTSGLLVVARTEEAHEALVDQLSARTVERTYLAVVWGHMEHDRGVVDAAIGRHRRHPTRMAVVADGREARTHYEVVARPSEPAAVSIVECRLETGRTHQIRVHLSAIGHPIVGDTLYRGNREALPFDRPALHAASLGFSHPVTGEPLRFEAEPPADLAGLLAELG